MMIRHTASNYFDVLLVPNLSVVGRQGRPRSAVVPRPEQTGPASPAAPYPPMKLVQADDSTSLTMRIRPGMRTSPLAAIATI